MKIDFFLGGISTKAEDFVLTLCPNRASSTEKPINSQADL